MKEKVKLLKAIADFQQEAPVLLRDTDGYGYKYVTFDHIVAKIKPLLKKHKISRSFNFAIILRSFDQMI